MDSAKTFSVHHIEEAIKHIDNNGDNAFESAVIFHLHYGNNIYAPLQVVNMAIELFDLRNSLLYSVQGAIDTLRKLGFHVKQTNDVWKLGCNWGRGAPSFYEILKSKSIVIDPGKFQEGDLILITEGFTVRALGLIKGTSRYIKDDNNIFRLFRDAQVFDEDLYLWDVEFYELPKIDIFTYELQQGIVRVRKSSVLFNAVNLWMHRSNMIKDGIEFRSYLYQNNDFQNWFFPCIGLRFLSNEVNGMKNSFQMTFFRDENNRIEIGIVFIYMENSSFTSLDARFQNLGIRYCSIGSTVEYYNRLSEVLPDEYENVLTNLNDIASNANVQERFLSDDKMKQSLLSTSETEYIFNNFEEIKEKRIGNKEYNFRFVFKIDGATFEHNVDFKLGDSSEISSRIFCIVGKNATGKTKLISQLANKLSNNNELGEFQPERPTFSKVVVSAFSYFDKFRFPKKIDTNYEFIGVRDENGLISEKKYSQLIWESYAIISKDVKKHQLWVKTLESTLEASHLNFALNELEQVGTREQFIEKTENIFSSGQNIVFQFLTRFIQFIELNSLLIFDEPETHLHPNIVGRLVRSINDILTEYKSYAIFSTHSPIILQEIPSKYIRIIDRRENTPVVYKPQIECFGENLYIISNSVFKVDVEKELYKSKLEKLAEDKMSISDVDSVFENKLSLNARMYFLKELKKND